MPRSAAKDGTPGLLDWGVAQDSRGRAIAASAIIAVIALGVSFYVLQLLYLGFLLVVAGRADTEPFQSAGFRHTAIFFSLLVAATVFTLFYRRQTQKKQVPHG